jgi:hypothetical protein
MRRYPAYTLSALLAEDIYALDQQMQLLSPDLGKANDDDGERGPSPSDG